MCWPPSRYPRLHHLWPRSASRCNIRLRAISSRICSTWSRTYPIDLGAHTYRGAGGRSAYHGDTILGVEWTSLDWACIFLSSWGIWLMRSFVCPRWSRSIRMDLLVEEHLSNERWFLFGGRFRLSRMRCSTNSSHPIVVHLAIVLWSINDTIKMTSPSENLTSSIS